MWIGILIATIPGFWGPKPFIKEINTPMPSYEACESHARSVARLGGLADIDPNYKVSCRKVDDPPKS